MVFQQVEGLVEEEFKEGDAGEQRKMYGSINHNQSQFLNQERLLGIEDNPLSPAGGEEAGSENEERNLY